MRVISVTAKLRCLVCGSDQEVLMDGHKAGAPTIWEAITMGWMQCGRTWLCPACHGREEASPAKVRKRKSQEVL